MSADPKIERYEAILAAMPAEFRSLAEWGWLELREAIEARAIAASVDPASAHAMAARLARLVVTQLYGDIKRYRQFQAGVGARSTADTSGRRR
jgi:hypothetical protein